MNKQISIFDLIDEKPIPKFGVGTSAKVRRPNSSDDCETQAVLDKYKGNKVVIISRSWSDYYHCWVYLLAMTGENFSTELLEADLI